MEDIDFKIPMTREKLVELGRFIFKLTNHVITIVVDLGPNWSHIYHLEILLLKTSSGAINVY